MSTVKLKTGKVEVRELSMREIMPLLEQYSEDSTKMAVEMCKVAVLRDGQPLGDSVLDLGFSDFNKLMKVVNDVNGLAGDEGNDG